MQRSSCDGVILETVSSMLSCDIARQNPKPSNEDPKKSFRPCYLLVFYAVEKCEPIQITQKIDIKTPNISHYHQYSKKSQVLVTWSTKSNIMSFYNCSARNKSIHTKVKDILVYNNIRGM